MKRRAVVTIFGIVMVICVGYAAPGNVYFQKGLQAELRKDWDTALINFQKAAQTQPGNAEYLLHERYARTEASLFRLKQGEQLLRRNCPDQALGEFQAAAQELTRLVAKETAAKEARGKTVSAGRSKIRPDF